MFIAQVSNWGLIPVPVQRDMILQGLHSPVPVLGRTVPCIEFQVLDYIRRMFRVATPDAGVAVAELRENQKSCQDS